MEVLAQAVLSAVPADGTRIGNHALFSRLKEQMPELDEARFQAARELLVSRGELARGRGRGGSVSRAQAAMPTTAEKSESNRKQAQTLTQLRDTLLPRLISGQLRLPEAEAMLVKAL